MTLFVAIDGPNGAGKTTAARALVESLIRSGRPAVYTKEPSTSALGLYARESESHLRGWPLAALYVADRHMHVQTEIEPAIVAGTAVVCDRYIGATLVLQRLDGLDRDVLREMNRGLRVPDLSVILLGEPDQVRERLVRRSTLSRFEQLPRIAEREIVLYREAAEDLEALGHSVALIDASAMTQLEVLEEIKAQLGQ
jgi:dTMP kinase